MKPMIEFEEIPSTCVRTYQGGQRTEIAMPSLWRARVPGGWFVGAEVAESDSLSWSVFFYPDPQHTWDGRSLSQGAQAAAR